MWKNSDIESQPVNMHSIKLQTDLCIYPSCEYIGEILCRHCSCHYCKLCYLSHRKNVLDDMRSIYEQMTSNRRVSITEVTTFIDKQAKDAHEQARKLIDDAIERIVKASKNIHTYIENRRQAKLGRLQECLENFDKDVCLLETQLQDEIFLPASTLLDIRQKYAYNMFDDIKSIIENQPDEMQRQNEVFFDDYRYFKELINLRKKWTFFQAALTTVYYPQKKDISLDKILTFLEYRHDRVLDNYREFLAKNDDSKESSFKSSEELLDELSFLPKKIIQTENVNFTLINQCENIGSIDEIYSHRKSVVKTSEIKQEPAITPKTDSSNCDDESNSTTSNGWHIEDVNEYDYDVHYKEFSHSVKTLENQFDNDLRLFINQDQAD